MTARKGFSRHTVAIVLWLLTLALCTAVILRTRFTADLSAFLPAQPTAEQQVLLDQLQAGVVSRLILVGIDGADAATRATVSKSMAQTLRADLAFSLVNNGEPVYAERDQAYLFNHRYVLSSAVDAERFTVAGLREALQESIDLIASSAGMLAKKLLPQDPTGELLHLLERMNGGNRPRMQEGVWVSKDGKRAILLLQTRASGSDTDAQLQAIQAIDQAFKTSLDKNGVKPSLMQLNMTGPGVFSVRARDSIESEVKRLSILSTVLIAAMLLLVYRSVTALGLGMLPVISGAIVGVAAVSLGFGSVHGLTLGFGTTLIGEAVDYSIYLFVQSRQKAAVQRGAEHWVANFWPTIRLGVVTSIAGFSTLLFSGFPGLAQLGLYSISGLAAAALVTRFVLPNLLPAKFEVRDVSRLGRHLARWCEAAIRWRRLAIGLILASVLIVVFQRDHLWNTELGSLSPVPAADQALDASLRADLGAPDVRYMVVIHADSREAALMAAEKVGERLRLLVEQGTLAAYESPAHYLPSQQAQSARRASLPADLQQRLAQAVQGMPVRAEVFQPFLRDAQQARQQAALSRDDLNGTSLALAVDSLLFERNGRWSAVLPLTAGTDAGIDVGSVKQALASAGQNDAIFVDLKKESDHLYTDYLQEAMWLSLAGLIVIALLLLWSLRSARQLFRVLLPLTGSVLMVVALLLLIDQRLTILHLIGLLLLVAVGSNYALFFSGQQSESLKLAPETLTSLAFANLTTVAGFGLLAISKVPILQAIGITVGPGAVIALVLSAVFATPPLAAERANA